MIISTFKRHGAETIDTPVFELKEVTSQFYEKIELLYAMVEEATLTHSISISFRILTMFIGQAVGYKKTVLIEYIEYFSSQN